MVNANLELIQVKNKMLRKLLKIPPIHFLLKFNSSLLVFHPTERLVENPFVHENLPFGGKGKILDVGSSSSLLPFELAAKGYKVWTIDLEENYHKLLKRSNVTFLQGDIRKTDFPDNFFDFVTAVSSIEHIGLDSPDLDLNGDKKSIQEIARILKPKGVFIMSVPFGKSGLYPINDTPSWRVYDIETLKDLLSPLKIKVIKFDLLDDVNWKPASFEEAKQVDSLDQPFWYSSRAIAMVIAKKPHFS